MITPLLFCASTDPAEVAYFTAIDHALKEKGLARPVMVLDLDRLDRNLAALAAHLKAPLALRVVEKSLPSVPLLRHALERTGSNRIMAFHHPFLPTLLREFPKADLLYGKTIPVAGVREVFAKLTPEERARASRQVQWLIDSRETLDAFIAFFEEQGLPFRASIELDVGLHRGGVQSPAELAALLERLRQKSGIARFSGLMGYDGHVLHVPAVGNGDLKLKAMGHALDGVRKRYAVYREVVTTRFADLIPADVIYNGAGSGTYSLYRASPDEVINDAACGSAVLKVRDYDLPSLRAHVPAAYVATPVLKRIEHAMIPFLGHVQDFFNGVFRQGLPGFYIYGGEFSEQVEYPKGVKPHALMKSTPNRNLVPNQGFIYGKPKPGLEAGDFVFFRPNQSDQIFLFEDLWLVRGGKIVGSWKPFQERL